MWYSMNMAETGEGINPNEEEHFDFGELPTETQGIYGTKEVYYSLVSQFIQHEIQANQTLEDYDASLYPALHEAEQFKSEIENPHFRTDTATGINYAVYRLN